MRFWRGEETLVGLKLREELAWKRMGGTPPFGVGEAAGTACLARAGLSAACFLALRSWAQVMKCSISVLKVVT